MQKLYSEFSTKMTLPTLVFQLLKPKFDILKQFEALISFDNEKLTTQQVNYACGQYHDFYKA